VAQLVARQAGEVTGGNVPARFAGGLAQFQQGLDEERVVVKEAVVLGAVGGCGALAALRLGRAGRGADPVEEFLAGRLGLIGGGGEAAGAIEPAVGGPMARQEEVGSAAGGVEV